MNHPSPHKHRDTAPKGHVWWCESCAYRGTQGPKHHTCPNSAVLTTQEIAEARLTLRKSARPALVGAGSTPAPHGEVYWCPHCDTRSSRGPRHPDCPRVAMIIPESVEVVSVRDLS